MSNETFQAPSSPTNREEVYLDAILRGLNNSSPTPEIPAPVWRIEQYLAAIAQAILNGGGGSSLPSVTPADNGKVLAVNDGAWAAGTPYVLVTQENNVASLKGSEINSLAASGVEVLMRDSNGLYAYVSENGTTAVFSGVTSALEAKKVSVSDNKGVTRSSRSVYSKPSGGIPETDLAQAVKNKLNKFIVTLTPTALDYSGTMDKTVAEINAAYEAGMEIWFRVYAGTSYSDVPLARYGKASGYSYPSFNVNFLYDEAGVLVLIYTGTTDDGTRQTYSTKVFTLTPAS